MFINADGLVETKQYQNAFQFKAVPIPITDIRDLGGFIKEYANDPKVSSQETHHN